MKNSKSNSKINNEHDKIFRKILDVKAEAADFINEALNLKNKITENQIEKYNSSFVTSSLKNEKSDVIYKLKSKNIFFLIEHQTKIDYTMPLRILEYETAIIKSAIDYERFGQKSYKIPIVIPIVLYTGKRKWNAQTYINEIQEKFEDFEELNFAKYNVVDINNIAEEKLLKDTNYLSKMMLLEKYRGKEVLIILIEQILAIEIGEEKAKEIIKILKGGNKDMLNCIENAYRENRTLFNNGIEKGRLTEKIEIIKELLSLIQKYQAILAYLTNIPWYFYYSLFKNLQTTTLISSLATP